MASDNEVLWAVTKRHWLDNVPHRLYLFRTRYAARKFRSDKLKGAKTTAAKAFRYRVQRASWGPEQ